jgi:hypothetical protein
MMNKAGTAYPVRLPIAQQVGYTLTSLSLSSVSEATQLIVTMTIVTIHSRIIYMLLSRCRRTGTPLRSCTDM